MACNCATTEQLNALYRKYGEKKDVSNLTFGQKVKNVIYKIGIGICMIPIIPAIIIYLFYKTWGTDDHRINVKKFFNLKGREIGANVG